MLRSAMRHAGMVRIDHALGLARSFWIPETGEPGGYVRYPLESLLAIIAIEAERNETIVVGEDLGLVAPKFREKLQSAGLYGCAVMQFEQHDGRFHDPRGWREMSLGSFGTHDTPTFEGYRQARDVEWGLRLSRGRQGNAQEIRGERRSALDTLFSSMDIDGAHGDLDNMHNGLARAGSAMVAVQLDDALGMTEQQNLPGTIDEHPNWRRRYEIEVDSLAKDARINRLVPIMQSARRSAKQD
jgi:4-alpha-glucanotransferase